MRRRLTVIVPLVLLLVLGGLYKVVLAKPAPAAKPKIAGQLYVMPKEFLVNLSDGHFAKVDVALVLGLGQQLPAAAEGGSPPPDGYGALPQEAAVRAVVTDTITDASSSQLIDRHSRDAIRRRILKGIRLRTDVHVDAVLFTDVAVQ